MNKILVTGSAGFIGSKLAQQFAEKGYDVIGLDNINNYYDVDLKYGRLESLTGVNKSVIKDEKLIQSHLYPNYRFIQLDIENNIQLQKLFDEEKFDAVCHLAAQAGVRYSIENPHVYASSNVAGFLNILEACRRNKIKHLVYASSSSVYGLNSKVPFSEKDNVNHPVSLYAATKKANELMAHSYSALYGLPTTGLRFFTVYGPWGRPDMAPFIFTDAVFNNRPIKVFNHGEMLRDFTYIDDVVEATIRVTGKTAEPDSSWNSSAPLPDSSSVPYRIYNIGNSSPVKLMDFIRIIEQSVGREVEKVYLPMQQGDVFQTFADTASLDKTFDFKPDTDIKTGVEKLVSWYRSFYKFTGF
ncbi:MAG: NAD-dependent epimerase [Dysgonamonadaceae bacterium]|jgi:UDP-glucuronate 4-epimerase|nr:NAD-dependent epimerase [Dysgonamonadaceae bacterium]